MQSVVHVQQPIERPGEVILAMAVIDRAVGDFLERVPMQIRKKDGSAALYPYRMALARRRVEAGRFLLNRHDPVAQLWFALADVSPEAWHRKDTRFQRRLARAERVLAILETRAKQFERSRLRPSAEHGMMRFTPRYA